MLANPMSAPAVQLSIWSTFRLLISGFLVTGLACTDAAGQSGSSQPVVKAESARQDHG